MLLNIQRGSLNGRAAGAAYNEVMCPKEALRLETLGGLELAGSDFTRVKPLLLLAYLALEGVKERRFLAELFWPGAADGLNSLSRALSQLRKGAPGVFEADEQRVWSSVDCDVFDLMRAHESKAHQEVVRLYRGGFLEGHHLRSWGLELEEWIFEQREALAGRVQEALLGLAEEAAAHGDFTAAAGYSEQAYTLAGAREPEPEALVRYATLLAAGESQLLTKLREEAAGYGIQLAISPEEARAKLQTVFLGRREELARLRGLPPGSIAWLQGAAGIGKTTLLRRLSGSYLPARSGLPYATLEPLLGDEVGDGEEVILRGLARREGRWLIDNWEWLDPESRRLLRRLRDVRPAASVIITSREPPAMRVDLELELAPLTAAELRDHPGAWEATGGLPALVGALVRGEPLEEALEARLNALPENARRVYLALALLEQPDPALVRRALGLGAAAMAAALQQLIKVGLADPSGRPSAVQAAGEYLQGQPVMREELIIQLARQLEGLQAYPLYSQAPLFWEEEDLPAVRDAYLAWAAELLRRGFPGRAEKTLREAPTGEAVTLLRAHALERAGLFRESLAILESLPETPEVLALRGALYWRLGHPEDARSASERALEGELEARAEALNTLGHLARSGGDNRQAAAYARRAASLWRSLGRKGRWVDALNNVAVARTLSGEETENAFQEALEAAGDNPLLRARCLLNLGWMRERRGNSEAAESAWREAAGVAEEIGALSTAAWNWNNIGVLHHRLNDPERAEAAYQKALDLVQQGGEQRILGMVMANLAELAMDRDAWEEALHLLEEAGHAEEARQYRAELPRDHPFRLQLDDGV